MKRIYCVQRFRPRFEATSKEVEVLWKHSKGSLLHDLHLDRFTRSKFSGAVCSYHFYVYPLFLPILWLLSRKRITHVYSSLVDFPYLTFLSKKRMVLTSTNFFSQKALQRRLKVLLKVKEIVVESPLQEKALLKIGVDPKKVMCIYPPVNLNNFMPGKEEKKKGKLTILNASCPTKLRDLDKRGIFLTIAALKKSKTASCTFLWRNKVPVVLKRERKGSKNISFREEIVDDMNALLGKFDCVIIPYTALNQNLKLVPNSALEALAKGKPVLVSSKTGLAPIVKKEKCGVVFEPTVKSLQKAISDMDKNYDKYQKNCRKTAQKYFDKQKFIEEYEKVYMRIAK